MAGDVADSQTPGDGGHDQRGVRERRQIDEHGIDPHRFRKARGDFDREPGLANTPRTRQRHKPDTFPAHEGGNRRHPLLPAKERFGWPGEPAGNIPGHRGDGALPLRMGRCHQHRALAIGQREGIGEQAQG